MRYKTCVTLSETSPSKLRDAAKKMLSRSTYIEARLDFLKPEEIPDALNMIKEYLYRTICTVRAKGEGGEFTGNEAERLSILKLVAEYEPFLLDIEYNTLRANSDLVRYLNTTHSNILVSWHNFKHTPSISILQKKIEQMARFSINVKIVCTAKSTYDATKMLSLYNKNLINLISFAMGEHGRISRILSMYMGCPYAYVSRNKPVAPGQFSLNEMKDIMALDLNQ